jgi:hypothetical protein
MGAEVRRLIPTCLVDEGRRCVVAHFAGGQAHSLCGAASPMPSLIQHFDGAVYYAEEPAAIAYFELPTCELCVAALETWDNM